MSYDSSHSSLYSSSSVLAGNIITVPRTFLPVSVRVRAKGNTIHCVESSLLETYEDSPCEESTRRK